MTQECNCSKLQTIYKPLFQNGIAIESKIVKEIGGEINTPIERYMYSPLVVNQCQEVFPNKI